MGPSGEGAVKVGTSSPVLEPVLAQILVSRVYRFCHYGHLASASDRCGDLNHISVFVSSCISPCCYYYSAQIGMHMFESIPSSPDPFLKCTACCDSAKRGVSYGRGQVSPSAFSGAVFSDKTAWSVGYVHSLDGSIGYSFGYFVFVVQS